ncbi:MAG: pyridoxal 5'-phosphate synthase glutaminase subunit PdxT [Candidatus Marinimicrobia bacterium]|nr:pyridoxal 5'-phosphate synthase glutaminase subunit PdxT [Candidatus Neomarinimicrobiota bacterium]
MTIGILALQGGFDLHRHVFENLGQKAVLIKYPDQLQDCDGLVIPGGESTTMTMQMHSNGLFDSIYEFSQSHPVMGTCAGAILMGNDVDDPRVTPLKIMNIECQRNSWGRQVFSFQSEILLTFDPDESFYATFIRAPKMIPSDEKIEILAQFNGEPILLTDGNHIAASFHPEIGTDYRIHEHYLRLLK